MGALLIAYCALNGLGGLIAYRRTNSKPSLVVGGFLGTLLIICGAFAWMGFGAGGYIGFALTILMTLLFLMRYRKTKKFRPAGFMLVLSLIVLVSLIYLLFF